MKLKFLALFFFFAFTTAKAQENAVLFGKIMNDNNQLVAGAVVSVEGTSLLTLTDDNGLFRLEKLPSEKKLKIIVSEISHEKQMVIISLKAGEVRNVNFKLVAKVMDAINVEYKNQKDEKREEVSIIKINPKEIESLPSAFGDFSKVLATLPGVSTNSELSTAYSVRGGNFDENLVYVNGIPIYRPFLVRSGQQEGLSFVNSSLVSDIEFSAGGWQPRYGDKLSSVLSIQYKTPNKFEASSSASLLGGGAHVEGTSKNKRLTYVAGWRYKDSRWILKRMDTGAEFRPWFSDFQSYLSYDLTNSKKHPNEIKTTIGWLVSYAKNSYLIIPEFKETNFGSFNQAKRIRIAFEGQEEMTYNTFQNGLKLDHKFNKKFNTNFVLSSLYTREREFFDIEGGMRLCDVSLDPSSNDFNKCVFTQDIGTEYRHGRNQLEAEIYNVSNQWEFAWSDNSVFEWGANYSNEKIVDVIDEYRFTDSADYVKLTETLFTDLNLHSSRVGAYFQHKINVDSVFTITYGVRSSFWDINKEITISPRAQASYKPRWKRDIIFKMASGVYHQPPFYRELRNDDGVLNKNLKAQVALHFIAGFDYNLKIWDRIFKWTSEAYYKPIFRVVPYDIDDIRLRYKAHNDATAYAYGADFRLSGEFIKGAESWFSLGLLRTRENLVNDKFIGRDSIEKEAGYVPRPTDQLLVLGVFFQDHLPNNPSIRAYVSMNFGSGLPFNIPGALRYRYTYQDDDGNTLLATSYGRLKPYRRLDLGFSKIITANENNADAFIKSIWIGVEVLNAFGFNNEISKTWVNDLYGVRYGIPNYLSARLFNLKCVVKF